MGYGPCEGEKSKSGRRCGSSGGCPRMRQDVECVVESSRRTGRGRGRVGGAWRWRNGVRKGVSGEGCMQRGCTSSFACLSLPTSRIASPRRGQGTQKRFRSQYHSLGGSGVVPGTYNEDFQDTHFRSPTDPSLPRRSLPLLQHASRGSWTPAKAMGGSLRPHSGQKDEKSETCRLVT